METTMRATAAALLCLGTAMLLPGCTAPLGMAEQPVVRNAPAQSSEVPGPGSGNSCWSTPRGIAWGIAGGAIAGAIGTFVPMPGFQLVSLDTGARVGCWFAAQLPMADSRPAILAPPAPMPREPEVADGDHAAEAQLAQLR